MVTIEKRKISDYFNPRPPRGGRLARYRQSFHGNTDFNPRPLRGGRHRGGGGGHVSAEISIHAPREGGDIRRDRHRPNRDKFQSTPPARGATTKGVADMACNLFQSTPPARGATLRPPRRAGQRPDFNPRPPRGGRRCVFPVPGEPPIFQSTPPARGATQRHYSRSPSTFISIHAPCEGGDAKPFCQLLHHICISIHAPREGGDSEAPEPE